MNTDKIYIVTEWSNYEGEYGRIINFEIRPKKVFKSKQDAQDWVDSQLQLWYEGFNISGPFEIE